MIWRFGHPSHRRLNQYADGDLVRDERARVAAHIARCPRCREEVDFIRGLGSAIRETPAREPGGDVLNRILVSVRAGERVILPGADLPPAARRRGYGRAAAVLAPLLIAAAALVVGVPRLTAHRSQMEISPVREGAVGPVSVSYESGVLLKGEAHLRLRARMHTASGSVEQRTIAELFRREGGRFEGELSLPDSVVYAIFAIEDAAGEKVDLSGVKPWEVLVRDRHGRPLFEALRKKLSDHYARNPYVALEAAREMVELYPDRAESWSSLYDMEEAVSGAASVDSLRRSHRPRFLAFHRALAATRPSAEELASMTFYSMALGDSALREYWQGRLLAEAPFHRPSLQLRLEALRRRYPEEPRLLLAALERLWTEEGDEVRDVASAGFAAARAAGDRTALLTWAERYVRTRPASAGFVAVELSRIPVVRLEGIERLRDELHRLERTDRDDRDLYLSVAMQRQKDERSARRILAALGAALVATGDVRAGLDTLRAAAESGWDPGAFRAAADALLAQGDTLAAVDMFARLAVDPATGAEAQDEIRKVAWRHIGTEGWQARIQEARERMHRQLLAETVRRPIRRDVQLANLAGERTSFASLIGGKVALISLWACTCGMSDSDIARFGRLAADLEGRGVRVVVITRAAPAADLEAGLRAAGAPLPVYADPSGELLNQFGYWSTAQHFLMDAEGYVRFEYTTVDDALRHALVLMPARDSAGVTGR